MCDTAVVVREGVVLFAKSSDRDPNEAQVLDWRPRARHPNGARLRCTWITIPQVRETHAVLLARPFWMWGAEIGANEHGVVIGNEAVFTRSPVPKLGLTGMDLVRLALERSATAREAVDVIVSLVETHGQGGRCGHEAAGFRYFSSFLVADARGAFVVETAGRQAAVERVEQGARSISNGLTIPGFAERNGDPLRTWACRARTRRARMQDGAAQAVDVSSMMRLLREHGDDARDGAPRYRVLNGAMGGPCVHAGGVVASAQTVGSWVAELREGCASHWVTGTAGPCTSLFKPVRVDEPLDLGPTPTDRDDGRSLFWRHERLHRAVARDPARLLPLFAPERDEVEARFVAAKPSPRDAFAEADALLARWTSEVERAIGPDRRPPWVRRYWRAREARARG